MKLTELRPCDNCGGPIGLTFEVVRTSMAVVNHQKANQFIGLATMLGNNTKLAEVFSPGGADDAVVIAMDTHEHKGLMVELFLCQWCMVRPICLAEVIQRRNDAKEKEKGPLTAVQADELAKRHQSAISPPSCEPQPYTGRKNEPRGEGGAL